MKVYGFIIVALSLIQCQYKMQKMMDIQGHRGWKGAYPENTWVGFREAVLLGVNTIELDVVISKDSQVIISHEPWFNSIFTTLPNGSPLLQNDEKEHNIYQLTYDDIKKYDVGSRTHPNYPSQKSIKVHKPSLKDVIDSLETEFKTSSFKYNIEIKRKKELDGFYHPDYKTFVNLVMAVIESYDLKDRVILQSFDHETLTYLHSIFPDYTTAILVEDGHDIEWHIAKLGYRPEILSPYFERVNTQLISECKEKNMKVIPWTVNDMKTAQTMIDWGVDGIITDYPEKLIALVKKR